MKKWIGSSTMLLLAAMGALMLFLDAASARAQGIIWNPPCMNATVVNTTECLVEVTIGTDEGPIGPFRVDGNGKTTVPVPTMQKGRTFTDVVTAAGTPVPIITPGPVPPPPAPQVPSTGSASGVTLGPNGCCVDIYFDVATCMIWIFPGAPPCTP